jgi:hypothetical protein
VANRRDATPSGSSSLRNILAIVGVLFDRGMNPSTTRVLRAWKIIRGLQYAVCGRIVRTSRRVKSRRLNATTSGQHTLSLAASLSPHMLLSIERVWMIAAS